MRTPLPPSSPARPPRPAPFIVPLSVAVPGRARLRVQSLRKKPRLASRLESQLVGHDGVRSVRANALTGTVLVFYDPARLRLPDLMAQVAHCTNGAGPAPAAASAAPPAWHELRPAAAIDRLATNPETGLSTGEALARLRTAGANYLPVRRPGSVLGILADHLCSLPVLLLGGAAALSLASGGLIDAAVILAVVAANTAVGYFTESRVERILASLEDGTPPQALVRRDNRDLMLPAAAVVPGDVLVLQPGHEVRADARVVQADGLAVDESALTGESVPTAKTTDAVGGNGVPLVERANMVFAGTVVVEGNGRAVVTATGGDTEFGRVRTLVAETSRVPTPLERQLDRVGRDLVVVSLGFCGATLALGLLRGIPALAMVRTAVALGVAAVPEGLPAVATTTLALGTQRLMRRGMLARRLVAVETLGAVTVICADKTGTLTENRMTVEAWHLDGREIGQPDMVARAAHDAVVRRALTLGVLCNEAELGDGPADVRGSSTEGALLAAALAAGVDYGIERLRYPLLHVRRRSQRDNWMATVHADGPPGRLVSVKGAPEQVLALADRWLTAEGEQPLTDAVRREILGANATLAARGLRVLGLAFAMKDTSGPLTYDALVWVGLVALTDPVRPGVREAIGACKRAGIRTVILTGDQARTAGAICRDLDLAPNGTPRVLEAPRLAEMGPGELRRLVPHIDVFARVSPADKYHIVRALQAAGEVVAMTGDGINDAAALRAADIGVAMGDGGTEVARDIADVVLVDDDYGALVAAVEQGRSIHGNIGKALRFLLATNFSEVLVTLGGLAVGLGHPMSAMQFLWINLVSDVAPALALAVEPPERDLMAQPPRDPAAPILSGPVLRGIAAEGGVMAGATLGAYALALARHGPSPQAATVAFSTLAGSQLLHALAHRARTAGSPFRPSPLVGVVGASLAVQAAAPRVPFLRGLLGLAPLSLADWALVAGGALIPLLLTEFSRRRGGSDGSVRHGQQVIQEDQQITEGGQHGQADARDVKGRRRNGARSRRGFGDGWPPKGAGRRAPGAPDGHQQRRDHIGGPGQPRAKHAAHGADRRS